MGTSFRARFSEFSQADPLQRDASVAHSPSRLCSYRVAFSDNPGRVIISSLVPNRYFMASRANNSDYGARTGAAPAFNDLYMTIRVVADHQRHCPVTRLHGLFRLRRGSTSRKKDEKGQNGGPGVPGHVHTSSLSTGMESAVTAHAGTNSTRADLSTCTLKSKIPEGLARRSSTLRSAGDEYPRLRDTCSSRISDGQAVHRLWTRARGSLVLHSMCPLSGMVNDRDRATGDQFGRRASR
jgi:hypothetical protein